MDSGINMPGRALIGGILVFLGMIAREDARKMRIPDWMTGGLGLLTLWAFRTLPGPELAERAVGMLGVSGAMLALCLLAPGAFGGGDIKLMFVCGFLLGWRRCMWAFSLAVFLAGIWALMLLGAGKLRRRDCFPFGPFLCLGVAVMLLWR